MSFIFQSSSFAQTTTQDSLQNLLYKFSLDELTRLDNQNLVTTASKKSERIEDAPSVISVIYKKDIENYGATNILDLLRRVTGIYVAGSGFIPDNMIALRGDATVHYSSRVLILLDGRPIRDNSSGGLRMAFNLMYPIERIERIEIIHGAGSVLYGTGAYLGVINVITKSIGEEPLSVNIQGGGFGRLQTSITKGFKKENFKLSLSGQIIQEKGWDFTATDGIPQVTRTIKMQENGYGLNAQLEYKKFKIQAYNGQVTQRAMYFAGAWSAFDIINGNDTTFSYKDYNGIHNLTFADAGYKIDILEGWSLNANVTLNHNIFRETAEDALDDIAVTSATDVLGEIFSSVDLGKKGTFVVGGLINQASGEQTFPVSLKQEKTAEQPFEAVGFGSFNIYNSNIGKNPNSPFIIEPYNEIYYSLYAQADYRIIPQLKLVAGGQFNKAPNVDIDFVPRLGVIANLSEEFTAKFLYSEAFRNGSAIERLIRVNFVFGNENLKPEKIRTTELNLSFKDLNKRFSTSLTYYYNNQQNLIVRSQQAAQDEDLPTFEYYINSGSRKSQGIELEIGYSPIERLELTASINVNDSFDELNTRSPFSNQDTVYVAQNIQAVPQSNAKIGFDYKFRNGISIGIFDCFWSGVTRVSQSPYRNTLAKELNPPIHSYHRLTANLNVNVGELFDVISLNKLRFSVYGDNLLNQQIMMVEPQNNVNTLPAYGGRAIYGTVKYVFE
ncbi:TonB-dependent receptor [Bernardetia sp. Wsw4-3y2]|uniref:TonB-dependent receptor plug domain-containing protein n=1 Tax=Bernardetia sp. Wsw4-3y2 TaxID=3127471 RepID=UPI0030D49FAA